MTVMGARPGVKLDTILFATDFSGIAEMAGRYAKALARRYSATVHLVHVIDIGVAFRAPDAGLSIDAFRRGAKGRLRELKEDFVAAGISCEAIACEGMEPAKQILQVAREKSADLIVTGTRGLTGLAWLALGSTAGWLIRHADCPVITVGPDVAPPADGRGIMSIVYATDFTPEAAIAAPFAYSFAQDSGAHVYLCHVLQESDGLGDSNSEELTDKFNAKLRKLIPEIAREWCEPECVLDRGYAADGILLLAHRVNADLIVLGTRKVSHWFEGLKAGIAYDVIRAAKCPVLTVRG